MGNITPFIVMTTIDKPSAISKKIIETAEEKYQNVVVVGDRKTPKEWEWVRGITYLPVRKGELLDSYARKNIGYLYAIKNGATHIFDMDDDNEPLSHWGRLNFVSDICKYVNANNWINIYRLFGEDIIWPRGLPLNAINNSCGMLKNFPIPKNVAIWQSLCVGEPDTDAIWRLLNNKEVYFSDNISVILEKNTICPFNAQNTLFNKEAFLLLYLPHTVTMRFSDILRSVIAQPILWAAGYLIGFTEATALHKRHEHDLMKDFYDEIPCYANIEKAYKIVKETVTEDKSIEANLIACYIALTDAGITTKDEVVGILNWCWEINNV